MATVLENYAGLLRATGREAEAAEHWAQAEAIRRRHAQQNPGSSGGARNAPRRVDLNETTDEHGWTRMNTEV